MQPKRDPSDRRFWPVRLGGTSGFSDYHKQGKPSPYRFGALRPRNSLSDRPYLPRMTPDAPQRAAETVLETVTPDTLRAQARLASVEFIDTLRARRSSMDVGALTKALNAAGKLSGAQSIEANIKHRHELRGVVLLPPEQIVGTESVPLALSNSSGDPLGVRETATSPDVVDAQVLDVQEDTP